MNLVRRSWLVILMTLFVGAGSSFAQSRVRLAQGRRAVKDKVSFVVEIAPDKHFAGDPRFAVGPQRVTIWLRLADHPVSGMVSVDGKAVGRFDEALDFNSNDLDVAYGRHTITLSVTAPTTLTGLYVDVAPGIAREILDDAEPSVVPVPDLSNRVAELERKVHDLENEIVELKKKRNH